MDIETGKKFVRERNYLEAEKIFLNLLKKDKDLMLVNYFLGTVIMDNKINPTNLADTRLSPSSADGDHTSGDNYVDFLADGFKVRSGSSTDINYSTSYPNHIFMAFAEIPSATPFDMFPNAR